MTNLVNIKVSFTSTYKIRVSIHEIGKPKYEVTLFGKEWKAGKGKEHIEKIMSKVEHMLQITSLNYSRLLKEECND